MKHHRLFYTLFIAVAFLAFTGQSCDNPVIEKTDEPSVPVEVTSFEECADAGYAVMESYPRQCNDGAGNHFVEEVEIDVIDPDPTPAAVETLPTVDQVDTVVPETAVQPVVKPGLEPEPEPQDSMEVDLDGINFGDTDTYDTPSQSPDYEVYDSPAADLDSINWADDTDYDDSEYYDYTDDSLYEDGTYDTTCTEGAQDIIGSDVFYCVDGIWTHEMYL